MNRLALAFFPLALVAASFVATPAQAQHGHRQYYGGWQSHPSGYAYRAYYYKPAANYAGYKHHYVIHHPKKPQHHYFYSPYTKKYWGRCPAKYGDKPVYSLLTEKDRHGDLEKIPEAAFPPPAALPAIPESTDGATIDLPPDDLPDFSALPGGAAAAAR